MTDPAHYAVSYQINPWMRPTVWSADPAAHLRSAKSLWRNLKAVIERHGGVVHVAQGATGMPDMVFPANAGVILNGRKHPAVQDDAGVRGKDHIRHARGALRYVNHAAVSFDHGLQVSPETFGRPQVGGRVGAPHRRAHPRIDLIGN